MRLYTHVRMVFLSIAKCFPILLRFDRLVASDREGSSRAVRVLLNKSLYNIYQHSFRCRLRHFREEVIRASVHSIADDLQNYISLGAYISERLLWLIN